MSAAGEIRIVQDEAEVEIQGGKPQQIEFVIDRIRRAIESSSALPRSIHLEILTSAQIEAHLKAVP